MDNHLISDPADIKILICYILASVNKPMKSEELCRVLSTDGAVNYFESTEAVAELVRDGFVRERDDGYVVSDKGLQIAATFNRKLPAATKQKAVESSLRLSAAMRSKIENPCTVSPAENGGFNVTMCIRDGADELMRVTLLASDREQAEALRKRFQSDPMLAYTGVIALLTGDIDSVGGKLLSSPQGE